MLCAFAISLASLSCISAQDLFLASQSETSLSSILPGVAGSWRKPIATLRPTVRTDCGDVVGVSEGRVYTFQGIQYAVAGRWQPPQSLQSAGRCWAPASFDASAKGPACIGLDGSGHSGEHCLTLSVWAPDISLQKAVGQRPCMVYFHGGDLTGGATGTNFSKLATHRSGLVVVDVSYRQNLAGFLSVDAMMEESASHTSGVFGFRDMLESLRWVKRNIAAFGGDASKVTIFGQSSGGTSVIALVASPLASGLFSGALSLSGSPNISMPAATQRKQHAHIVKSAGCASGSSTEIMSCLRTKSLNLFGRLWLSEPKGPDHAKGTEDSPSWTMDNIFDIPRYRDGLRAPGLAVVDGDVVREPVAEAYRMGRNDVPVVFSSMAQECGGSPGLNVSKFSAEEFVEWLGVTFKYVNDTFGSQVADMYAPEIAHSTQLAFDTIAADISMTCGNAALATAAGKGFATSPVYLVHNEQHPDDGRWAFHGYDLHLAIAGEGPAAVALRDAWYEFASTGKVATWHPVTAATPWATNRVSNSGSYLAVGWKKKQCDFWKAAGFGPEFWWSN